MSADVAVDVSIKPGINYAPPFDDVAITANDFITALKRTADPKTNVGGYLLLPPSSRGSTTTAMARPTRSPDSRRSMIRPSRSR